MDKEQIRTIESHSGHCPGCCVSCTATVHICSAITQEPFKDESWRRGYEAGLKEGLQRALKIARTENCRITCDTVHFLEQELSTLPMKEEGK